MGEERGGEVVLHLRKMIPVTLPISFGGVALAPRTLEKWWWCLWGGKQGDGRSIGVGACGGTMPN